MVGGAFVTARSDMGIAGQRGDERVDLLSDEVALARSRLDQAKVYKPLLGYSLERTR
jgi:hypothetical protein